MRAHELHITYGVLKTDKERYRKFLSIINNEDFKKCALKLALGESINECLGIISELKEVGLIREQELTFPVIIGEKARKLSNLANRISRDIANLIIEKVEKYWIVFRTVGILGELDTALERIMVKNDVTPQKTALGEIFLCLSEIGRKVVWRTWFNNDIGIIRAGDIKNKIRVNNLPKELYYSSDLMKSLALSIFRRIMEDSEKIKEIANGEKVFNHLFYWFSKAVLSATVYRFLKENKILWNIEIVYKTK